MNEEKLIWGASYIDDDLVCEAIDYKPRRIRLAPWACAAAAAVVMVTAFAVFARQIGSSPVIPPDPAYTGNSENTTSVSSSELDSQVAPVNSGYPDYTSPSRDPEPVDIGNGMTLTGTPIDSSELEEFSIEPYIGGEYLEADEEFLDSLGNPELKGLYERAGRLFAFLSQSPPKPAFAAEGNERKPAYIVTADGKRYEEWGYTYESFYNAFLSAFTKEAAAEIFKEFDFCTNYNGELFFVNFAAGGNVWDGYINEVHREYELISKSDTVIKFRRIAFGCDRDFKPAAEYIPELRDEYAITYTDFEFALTENGWRAAGIPEETDEPVTPGTPTGDKRAYDDVFEKFYPENQNPTMYGPPMTCEEIMNGLKPRPDYPEHDVDSYYLVEVIRALTSEEYTRMNGWDWSENDNKTIYEVKLIEDLISGEKTDRTEFICLPTGRGANIQMYGDPTYAPGERLTAALTKPCEGYDFVLSTYDFALRYDLPQMSFTDDDEETMLYFRGRGQARQPIPDLPFETEDINIEAAYSTSQNPATYIQKIALDDLVEFLRTEWEKAGISSHFENHAEN